MSGSAERIVPPNTSRIVEGLRDTGYTFEAALADLVDNSISHGSATVVSIRVLLLGEGTQERAVVQVADNGSGMDEARLENAMRYGADEVEDRHSLGKFGLGLKTASTSFCRRLTVLTRSTPSPAPVLHAVWDLDRIAETGEWLLGLDRASDELTDLFEDELETMEGNASSSGTVIVWQKVDRLLKTKAGTPAKDKKRALDRVVREATEFLGTVFQRFLDPQDPRAATVRMTMNDEVIEPWDPFMTGRFPEALVRDTELPFEDGDGTRPTFRSYILPAKREMAEGDRTDARHGLERQGIYLYREERQIDGPPLYPWLRLYSPETHQNNHRVEVSFPATMDDLFGVGLRKSGVELSAEVKEELERQLTPLRREADNRSRKGSAEKASETGNKRARATESVIGRKRPSLTLPTLEDGPGDEVRVSGHEGDWIARDQDGRATGVVRVRPDDDARASASVARETSLEDGVLYEPVVGQVAQVAVNTGHDWYLKAVAPNEDNAPLMQALDFLLYALAQAELMVTDESLWPRFRQFRVDVSRNLRELVEDLDNDDD